MTWEEIELTTYPREGMIVLSVLWNVAQMSGLGAVISDQGSHGVGQARQKRKTAWIPHTEQPAVTGDWGSVN